MFVGVCVSERIRKRNVFATFALSMRWRLLGRLLFLSLVAISSNLASGQTPFSFEPPFDAQFGSPELSETPFLANPPFQAEDYGALNGSFSSPLSVSQELPYATAISSLPNGGSVTGSDGANYVILGDVSAPFAFGDSRFDNIPFLNEGRMNEQRKLPELKVPQNDKELAERIDALLKRFSRPNLSILRSTPGRLLRYSLIAGADEMFLAPKSEKSANSQNQSETIYALGALCWNLPCAGRHILRVVDHRPVPEVGYGFQSQRGELLAALAFAKIDRNYELRVEGEKFSVQDLVEWEKYSCTSGSNLSLVAVGLAHYSQDPDEVWVNQFGEEWSLLRLLEEESRRPVDWNSADSTDKLIAFAYLLARLKRSPRANTSDLEPTLQKTEAFLVALKKKTWELFEADSLSDSLFFNSAIKLKTPYMKLYVNGRLLRWLSLVCSEDELRSAKMKSANGQLCALVDQLFNSLDDLSSTSNTDEESFSIALQTLAIYRKLL